MAHARRKFYDLYEANQSTLAAQALEYIGQLYMIERETKDLPPDKRHAIRHAKARPIADALHQWTLDSANALSGRWHGAERQQLGRESNPSMGTGSLQLAIRRFT